MNVVLNIQSIIKYFVIIKEGKIVDFRLDFDNYQNI